MARPRAHLRQSACKRGRGEPSRNRFRQSAMAGQNVARDIALPARSLFAQGAKNFDETTGHARMPDSLREGGYSSFSADPRELAVALVNHLAEHCS